MYKKNEDGKGNFFARPSVGTAILGVAMLLMVLPSATAAPTHHSTGAAVGPLSFTSTTNTNTAGYGGSVTSGTVTRVHGSWNIPKTTCLSTISTTQYATPYITVQGPTPTGSASKTVALFVGTQITCAASSSAAATVSAFYQFLGGNNVWTTGTFSLTISLGDQVSATLSVNAKTNKSTATITDLTTKTTNTFSAVEQDASYVITPVWPVGTGPALAKFTSAIRFTGCTYVDGGTSYPVSALSAGFAMTLVDSGGNTMAKISSLSAAGNSFQVTWVRST